MTKRQEAKVLYAFAAQAAVPLFIPLYTRFFEAFKRGTKKTEFRDYGPRWNERTCLSGRAVTLSKGYGKYERLSGRVVRFSRRGDVACIRIDIA